MLLLIAMFQNLFCKFHNPSKPHFNSGLYNQEKKPPPAFLTTSAVEEITFLGHKSRNFAFHGSRRELEIWEKMILG